MLVKRAALLRLLLVTVTMRRRIGAAYIGCVEVARLSPCTAVAARALFSDRVVCYLSPRRALAALVAVSFSGGVGIGGQVVLLHCLQIPRH